MWQEISDDERRDYYEKAQMRFLWHGPPKDGTMPDGNDEDLSDRFDDPLLHMQYRKWKKGD